MRQEYKDNLLKRINRKDWWHCPPTDPKAYSKRGMFLASTFREAEFWGRPLDAPKHVNISNPLIGDETTIETALLGALAEHDCFHPDAIRWRHAIDAKLYKAGRAKGYDAIVLLSPSGFAKFTAEGRLPLSIELNLLRGDWE